MDASTPRGGTISTEVTNSPCAIFPANLERSAKGTGSIPGAGTRYQRAAGIDDSPARLIEDLMRIAGETDCDVTVPLPAVVIV